MEHKISIKTFNDGILSVDEFKNKKLNNKEVVGIVLQTNVIGLILALPSWEECWGSDDFCVDVTEDDYISEAKALTELCGFEATQRIVDAHSTYEGMFAAKRCLEYKCADLQWYLPSLYELGTIAAFKKEINDILEEIGLENAKLKDKCTWTSSETYQTYAWYVNFSSGYFCNYFKYISYVVRAVCAFEPLRGVLSTPSENNKELTDSQLITLLKERGYKGQITKTLTL